MRTGAQIQLKTLLRGVVRSRPVRGISEWLHAEAAGTGPPAKICFIHVPKTGGTFVTQRENNDQTIVFPMQDLNHATLVNEHWEVLRDVPAPFGEANALPLSAVDDLIVFSNVRNIFSFLVSYFHHAAGHVERYRNPHHYDFSIAHRGFDYLIKTVSDRGSIWPSRKFVHFQLFSQPSGVSIVDWINCTATLDRDLRAMAQIFGLDFRAGKPQRQGPLTDYRSYYSDALADLVARTWKREIELFGFGFDRPQSRYTPIELADRARGARYVWRDDQLLRPDPDIEASRAKVSGGCTCLNPSPTVT